MVERGYNLMCQCIKSVVCATSTVTKRNKILGFVGPESSVTNRVFHSLYKVGRNGNLVFKGFNNSKKKLPSVGLYLMLLLLLV